MNNSKVVVMTEETHEEVTVEACGCTYRYYFDKYGLFIRKDLEAFCPTHEKEQIEKVNRDMNVLQRDPLAQGGP